MLWNVVTFLAVVNLLALLIIVAWLWQTGRLTRGRIDDIRSVLSRPESESAAAASRSVGEAEIERVRALEERRKDFPPVDSATQIRQIALVQQQREQATRRLSDERAMLSLQLSQATARMEANIAEFERQRSAWLTHRSGDATRKIDEQFLQAVRQIEQLPPKQAKGIIQRLVTDNNASQAVAYLDAMSPRSASRVLREFKSDAEIVLATSLLEQLRTYGLPPADTAPVGMEAANGSAPASNDAAASNDNADPDGFVRSPAEPISAPGSGGAPD
jgi:hypothetical protein